MRASTLNSWLVVSLLMAGTFTLDIELPHGYVVSELYVLPVLASLWLPDVRAPVYAATACTGLTILGALVSPPAEGFERFEWPNRLLALTVVWSTAALCVRRRTMREALQRAHDELEQRAIRLAEANARLELEIAARSQVERELRSEQLFLKQLFDVQERDRPLMSLEIHDGIVQYATAALLQAQAHLERLTDVAARLQAEQIEKLLRKAVIEGRRLISGIRPPDLDEHGVSRAIAQLIAQQPRGAEIEFSERSEIGRLPPEVESTVFRIVQEALTNAQKHAPGAKVRVTLGRTDGEVVVEIQDWGGGFDRAAVPESRHGLRGMSERVRLVGGEMTIESEPGRGTHIIAKLPVQAAED